MTDTRTERLREIAHMLVDYGYYTAAGSIAAVTEERDALRAIVGNRHSVAITPDVPDGFDTILGYLAKHDPDVLDQFDYYDPQATQRDGFWMMHHATDRRVVSAPACLQMRGIKVVNAWPLSALQERFG